MAQAGRPQRHRSVRARKRAQVAVAYYRWRDARSCRRDLHAGVRRRILYDVEGHVAKVPLVGDAVASANAGLAVAEDVVSEANARPNRAIVWIPQSAHWALRRNLHRAIADSLKESGSRTKVKVGIEVLIVVVLHTEIFVTEAVVERKSGRYTPTIFQISCPIVVTVAACEAGLRRRER